MNNDLQTADKLAQRSKELKAELAKVIVGQEDVIEQLLITIFANAHCYMVGLPGLAKTLMISSLAKVLELSFKRIQFTPDLMPSDITGTDILQEDEETGQRKLMFRKGPVFANIVLADEINRTPPKTQAALLEAMQERQVTAGRHSFQLDPPFFVLATQNPIEQEGTYPLPEAQLDRFMFSIKVNYPNALEEMAILKSTTSGIKTNLRAVLSKIELLELQELVKRVPVAEHVFKYTLELVRKTRPSSPDAPLFIKESLEIGAGPRAGQNLILGAKARALIEGRQYVTCEDIAALALPVLRHRIAVNFNAEADGVDADQVITRLLQEIPKSQA
jgi:MoxR-like ATPase